MSEEATQDTGSQEAVAAEAAPVSFLESLPEELRNEPSLRTFTDPGALAKSYVSAQRMIGADKIAIPGKHAGPDEWREVYNRLGAPTEAKGYTFDGVDGVDENALNTFREQAYNSGLTNRQANDMIAHFQSITQSGQEAAQQEAAAVAEASLAELQREYGRAFDQKLDLAQVAARTFLGGTELFDQIELADGRLLGDHPDIVRMFVALGEQIGEDQLVGEPSEMVMTPQEAQRQIDELTLPNSPYWDKNHPNKDRIVEEVLRLREYL
jgi:hypothetical protein